jgi:transcriptional regulator with XRE-family HTH domain
MAITGNQIKAARALAGIGQTELAEQAGVGVNTVRNMEARGPDRVRVRSDTLDAVTDALRALNVVFVADGDVSDGGAGVRMRRVR